MNSCRITGRRAFIRDMLVLGGGPALGSCAGISETMPTGTRTPGLPAVSATSSPWPTRENAQILGETGERASGGMGGCPRFVPPSYHVR